MKKTYKIYVAGHRGLVGSAILRRLQELGYQNIVVRTHQELDLTNQADVEDFFSSERPEYVFLAAARVGGILVNFVCPAQFIYENLAIQTNVIHAAYKYGMGGLLFLGSSCIYPKNCPQPIKEKYLLSGPLESTNEPYAVAKIAGIKMCQAYNRQYGTRFISVMPTNLYGPNDNFDLLTSHALPALIRKCHLAKLATRGDIKGIRRDEARFGLIPQEVKTSLGIDYEAKQVSPGRAPLVVVWGTGQPRREFLHVDDLADACVFLMNHYDGSGMVNIGVGKDLTIAELAKIVARVIGFEGEICFDTSKPDGTPRKLLDVSHLRALGWEAKIPLARGIKMTYEWYLKQ